MFRIFCVLLTLAVAAPTNAQRAKFAYADTEFLCVGSGCTSPVQCRASDPNSLLLCSSFGAVVTFMESPATCADFECAIEADDFRCESPGCIDTAEIADGFVHNSGDDISGDLALLGNVELQFAGDRETWRLTSADTGHFQLLNDAKTVMSFGERSPDEALVVGAKGLGLGGTPDTALHLFGKGESVQLRMETDGDFGTSLLADAPLTFAAGNLSQWTVRWAGNTVGQIRFRTGADTVNQDGGEIVFRTATGGTLSERMVITEEGRVGIGASVPSSLLSVGAVEDTAFSYVQIDSESGPPPAADCDADAERGREFYDFTNHRRYTCGGAARGWDHISLTD